MKKYLKRIFDWYLKTKAVYEEKYYASRVQEHYSPDLVKAKLQKLSYRHHLGSLKILKVYQHHNWEDLNLLPAMRNFGTVTEYPLDEVKPYSLWWQLFKKISFNRAFVKSVAALVKEDKINVIFFYASGSIFLPSTLRDISRLGIASINLALDDYLKFKGYPTFTGWSGNVGICKYMTLTLTSYRKSCDWYLYEGGRPLYMPEGGNENHHKPLPGVSRDLDVVFIGKNYGVRQSVVNYLRQNGVNLTVFGRGWEEGGVSAEKLIELYSRAKIALGFSDSWGGGWFDIPGRDFEVPLIGPLYLTQENPNLGEFYDVGSEIVMYKNKEDLLEKIRYYLSHDAEREPIAAAGRARALRDHTWTKRFEYIFKLLDLI